MDHHPEQSSSNYQAHSDELQLVVLTQQNRRLMTEISPFDIKQYHQNQDELNILLNIAKQLKTNYFALEQEPFLSLPDVVLARMILLLFVYLLSRASRHWSQRRAITKQLCSWKRNVFGFGGLQIP